MVIPSLPWFAATYCRSFVQEGFSFPLFPLHNINSSPKCIKTASDKIAEGKVWSLWVLYSPQRPCLLVTLTNGVWLLTAVFISSPETIKIGCYHVIKARHCFKEDLASLFAYPEVLQGISEASATHCFEEDGFFSIISGWAHKIKHFLKSYIPIFFLSNLVLHVQCEGCTGLLVGFL